MSDDAFVEFLSETEENLELFERKIVELESSTDDSSIVNEIFRAVHTIKGTAGFFGFDKIQTLGHAGENVLGGLRDKSLTLSAPITSALLETCDMLRTFTESIKRSGDEGNTDPQPLIGRLKHLLGHRSSSQVVSVIRPVEATPEKPVSQQATTDMQSALASLLSGQFAAHQAPAQQAKHIAAPEASKPATFTQAENAQEDSEYFDVEVAPRANKESIRIDVDLLENLMDLVGEIVLTRNQLLRLTAGYQDNALSHAVQQLNLLTSDLQESATKTRMQPISNVWQKLPRVVRDLALSCGKNVEVVMQGQDTDLDKAVLEAIKDPLTHIVRNAVDHGVEIPAVRVTKGKPPAGTLLLRAFHSSGKVNIQISDDGNGISVEKIKKKAIEKKLISVEQSAKMSEREILDLIFLPGFSTAEKVTNISGRGVGMDVVRSNIEKIGGSVEIQSTEGLGSTFLIRIPLTLAIIPALLVVSGEERFAIPQSHLCELLYLSEQDSSKLEYLHNQPVYRLRGNLLPLVFLHQRLGFESKKIDGTLYIAVIQSDKGKFGLVVDQINDNVEIVVKPLCKQLKSMAIFSGATILGDGRISLILDTTSLAPSGIKLQEDDDDEDIEEESEPNSLLLLQSGACQQAFPLQKVERLEKIELGQIERSECGDVAQYRGNILRLVHLSDLLGLQREESLESYFNTIVMNQGDSPIGLVVGRVLDVVDGSFPLRRRSNKRGLIGAAIIQDKITDVIDADAILEDLLQG
jgi:two-component system chemotaxis sensor kinase CheA